MSKIINLFAAPGVGKSTLAAGLFYELKLLGYSTELINEYAKLKVWQEDLHALANQAYITITQYFMQDSPHGKVQCIITDSPIPLGIFYQRKGCTKSFEPYIIELFNQYDNLNFMLKMSESHKKTFSTKGRLHNYDESLEKEKEIQDFLDNNSIPYNEIIVDGRYALEQIKEIVIEHLSKPKIKTF